MSIRKWFFLMKASLMHWELEGHLTCCRWRGGGGGQGGDPRPGDCGAGDCEHSGTCTAAWGPGSCRPRACRQSWIVLGAAGWLQPSQLFIKIQNVALRN